MGEVKKKFFDEHGDEICELCQDRVIGGPASVVTPNGYSSCEGNYCDDALELFLEEMEENQDEN